MPTIILKEETYFALLGRHPGSAKQIAHRNIDGSWSVPLESSSFLRIERLRLEGESDDDVITRTVSLVGQGMGGTK